MAKRSKGISSYAWYAAYAIAGYYGYQWYVNRQAQAALTAPVVVNSTQP